MDASKHGLGAVIMQQGHPLAYASKALDCTQTNYAVIEKELLAICFGCKRFHEYLYGKQITVETDHKPLLAIMTKPLHMLSARMQRMRMRLQHYNLKLIHRPGKEMFIADTLSRAFANDTEPEDLFDDEVEVNIVQVSQDKLIQFRNLTAMDPSLQNLKNAVLHGWPDQVKLCTPDLRPYFTYRDEITYEDELLFKGNRIIIPSNLRSDMLKRIHESHMGITKSKQLARDFLYWPGMSAQIEDVVSKCSSCQSYRKQQSVEPMISHDIPNLPWSKVATDLFSYKGRDYIICVDYFSKYPDIALLPDTSADSVISALKTIFARFGIPDTCISDNGPQYASYKFAEFARTWEFEHKTSSPAYPQSNGQVERAIQTVKNIIKKCDRAGDDANIGLLNYRNTQIDGVNKSPAQMLFSKRLRSRIPTKTQLLKSSGRSETDHSKLKNRQNIQKRYYDRAKRTTMPKADLHTGDKIRFRTLQGEWKPGTVHKNNIDTPRSYEIHDTRGKIFNRNRMHILPTKEQFTSTIPERIYNQHSQAKRNKCTEQKQTLTSPEVITRNFPADRQQKTPIDKVKPDQTDITHQNPVTVTSVQTPTQNTVPVPPMRTTRSGRQVKPVERLDL